VAKRYRQFKRINLTANMAKFIRESLVDKTLLDHAEKCVPEETNCLHHDTGNMGVARLVESKIVVGKKRGYLDVPCPYAQPNAEEFIKLLDCMSHRLRQFVGNAKTQRTRRALLAVVKEIDDYAHRNAMEVLAAQVVDVADEYDFSKGERGKYADR